MVSASLRFAGRHLPSTFNYFKDEANVDFSPES